eukprot:366000-Chlamydomonas_euryale.AAC.54
MMRSAGNATSNGVRSCMRQGMHHTTLCSTLSRDSPAPLSTQPCIGDAGESSVGLGWVGLGLVGVGGIYGVGWGWGSTGRGEREGRRGADSK